MYADGCLLFPYLQGLDFYRETQQCHLQMLREDELLWRLQNSTIINNTNHSAGCGASSTTTSSCSHLPVVTTAASGSTLIQASRISEYDLGGEGDLFKAPEPILEAAPELAMAFDPMATAISLISAGAEDIIAAGEVVVRAASAEMDTLDHTDPLLSEVFYECRKDLLAKSAIDAEDPVVVGIDEESVLELQIAELQPQAGVGGEQQDLQMQKAGRVLGGAEVTLQKSVSSGCLLSGDWNRGQGGVPGPTFLGFQDVDLGAAFGLRRAYSEGDIKTLESGNIGHVSTREIFRSEERQQKLFRYRKKKSKRNFGRKIKYACRKALADSQPRVRGRFARTEECELAKQQ